MKNYINIEGKKIYLTAEQVDELRSIASTAKVKLAEIAPPRRERELYLDLSGLAARWNSLQKSMAETDIF